MKKTFRAFKTLRDGDFRVLSTIEACQRKGQFAPLDAVQKHARMDLPDLEFHLKKLDENRLVQSRGHPYTGYRLLHTGYDFLALNALVQRDEVESIGNRLAVGKESEVYEAIGPDESRLVLKLHRLGMTSFSKAPRLRVYLGDRRHYSWIYAARLAAERENEALVKLKGRIRVPEIIDQNRNAILMERFEGVELSAERPEYPGKIMDLIIREAERAKDMGIVHGDLSEFNVMINGEEIAIIDWPQWVESDHPQADSIHGRDIENIRRFFAKKFP